MRIKHFIISGAAAAIIGLTAVSAGAEALPAEEIQIDADYENQQADAGNYDDSDFGIEEETEEPEEEGMIDHDYENPQAEAGNYDNGDFGLEEEIEEPEEDVMIDHDYENPYADAGNYDCSDF